MAWYQGRCRITVTGVDADWPQRAVVTVRGGGRTIVIPGTLGASQVVEAESWDLAVEHRVDGVWHPNIRAIRSRWEWTDGVQSQLIRSKDRDWPGDRRERNLVLRVERTVRDERVPETAAVPPVQCASTPRVQASTPRVRTTASDGTTRTDGTGTAARVTTSTEGTQAPARVVTAGEGWQALL